jgi:hypothetical protein
LIISADFGVVHHEVEALINLYMSPLNLTKRDDGYLSCLAFAIFLLLFPVLNLHAQGQGQKKSEVIPVLECVTYVGSGKFTATFGYDNQSQEVVSVSQSNSTVVVGSSKSNGVNTFKAGRQYSVFKKDFTEREVVVWTIILPNGKQKQVTASANSTHCKDGSQTGNIFPYYPPPGGGKTPTPVGPELTSLYERYVQDSANVFTDDIYQIFDGHVLIEIVAEKEYINQLRETLATEEYGFKDEIANVPGTPIITGLYPIVNLLNLNNLDAWIRFVRPVYLPLSNAGLVTTQGDLSQRSDFARQRFHIDGTGVKVGVMSDSYNTRIGNEAATDVLNDDLPVDVDVVGEYPFGSRSDEGRAMMQIIHDVAPGADLAFRTGFVSPGDLALGIGELKDAGCDIIVDDITYITEPYFVDGRVAQAVDAATAEGVSYFSSAGNFGSRSYQKAFNPTTAPAGFTGSAHNFGGGDVLQRIALTEGVYTIVMQWVDDIYTLGSSTAGTQNDLDIYILDDSGNVLFGFNRNNIGGDPIEVLPFTVVGGNAMANLLITKTAGTQNPLIKYIVFRGDMMIAEFNTNSSTIIAQANANGAMAVGAVLYSNTPRFGVNPPTIASFSSTGGTPVNGVVRNKPDFTAPNGGNTTVPLGGVNIDGDPYPNFFGTSASAPHAAGSAALLHHARSKFFSENMNPATTRTLMRSTALDMGTAGFDNSSGYGFIQTDAAIATFAAPSPFITKFILPGGAVPGLSSFKVIVEGQYLNSQSIIYLRGVPLATRLVNVNQVEATIPAFTGNPPLQVYNPPVTPSGLDGGFSNSLYFYPRIKITVTADNKSKSYGEAVPELTATISTTASSLAGIIAPVELETPATNISNVGNYIIKPHTDFLDSIAGEFYELILVNGVLSIYPIDLVVQPNDLTIPYGAKIPEITFQYHYSDSLIQDNDAILDSLISTHESIMAKNIVALVTGQTNVTGKALVNTSFLATSNTITTGKALVNGTVITEVDVALLDSTALANGTSALINGSGVVTGKALVNGTAIVTGKALVNTGKALVNAETINEENNNGALVIVNESDSLVANLFGINLITDTLAGDHFIVPAALLTKNFNVSYEVGNLKILPGTLTISADDKTIKAGDPLPTFTSVITGFVNSESAATVLNGPVTYTLQPAYAGAGTYQIVPYASLKEPANYSTVFENGTLYVNPFGPGASAVRPFLYCVEELTEPVEGFFYVAHFGYKNSNSVSVSVPLGNDNYISSEGSFFGNPPTVFSPGEGTFDIYFDGSKTNWILKTAENTKKTAMASVASSSSNRCNRYEKTYGIKVEALYPNPVIDNLRLLFNDIPQQFSASAYNELSGKSYNLKSSSGQYANEVQINMQSLPSGLYYLKILVNNKAFSYRVMKQ